MSIHLVSGVSIPAVPSTPTPSKRRLTLNLPWRHNLNGIFWVPVIETWEKSLGRADRATDQSWRTCYQLRMSFDKREEFTLLREADEILLFDRLWVT